MDKNVYHNVYKNVYHVHLNLLIFFFMYRFVRILVHMVHMSSCSTATNSSA